jgi:NADH-quinone oxidoreductase subunit M
MLTLYRKVIFGELVNPKLAAITDMDAKEIFVFVPLIASALILGFYPSLVFDQTAASAGALVDLFHASFSQAQP